MSDTSASGAAETQTVDDLTAHYAALLASGERVLLVRQRHWLTFLEAGRWFVAALVCGILLLLMSSSLGDDGVGGALGDVLGWGFWLFLLVGVLGVGWFFLVWRVERYLVTTRRVIETGGVINRYARDTTLSMITDMVVGHPWLGRIVGYGEIDLLTGSELGTSKIRFLPDADGFKKTLLDAKYEHELEVGGGRTLQDLVTSSTATTATASRLTAEEVDATLTRLTDMRDRGLITQDELEAKKKDLLDRL